MYEWPLWTVFSNAQTQWLTICSYVPAPNKIDESLWRHFCTLSIWACNSNQSFDSVSDQFLKGKWTNEKKSNLPWPSGRYSDYPESFPAISKLSRPLGWYSDYAEFFQVIRKFSKLSRNANHPPIAPRPSWGTVQNCRAKVTYDPKKKHYRDLHLWPKTSFNLSHKRNNLVFGSYHSFIYV